MGIATSAKPVKIFTGILTSRQDILPGVYRTLQDKLGPVDYTSGFIDFNFTSYYEKEMGTGLKKQFLGFEKLVSPEKLAEIKLFTNKIEQSLSDRGKRLINIDPGYLNESRVVLASTKDFSHRIYLGEGIYAEITLLFQHKHFELLPWTYPDFRSDSYQNILHTLRRKYVEQIKKAKDA